MLRPGRAIANDAADQIAVLDAALAQLPEQVRSRVLVHGDTGSGVQPFLWHVTNLGLEYSVGVNHTSRKIEARWVVSNGLRGVGGNRAAVVLAVAAGVGVVLDLGRLMCRLAGWVTRLSCGICCPAGFSGHAGATCHPWPAA